MLRNEIDVILQISKVKDEQLCDFDYACLNMYKRQELKDQQL